MRHAKRLATIGLMLALAGCGTFDQDGQDTSTRIYSIPVLNDASRAQPFAQPMGEAIPDTAWVTEGASECEPWQTRDNGCGRGVPGVRTVVATTPRVMRTHAHRDARVARVTHRRNCACIRTPAVVTATPTPPTPPAAIR